MDKKSKNKHKLFIKVFDKNNKRLFLGDIIKHDNGCKFEIIKAEWGGYTAIPIDGQSEKCNEIQIDLNAW